MKILQRFSKNSCLSPDEVCCKGFILKKESTFAQIYIMPIRWRRNKVILKTLEKFVLPANENSTTIFKEHVYESWRCLFRALISKNGNYFCLDLHYVHKVEMGQRHTEKYSKNLLYPQMRIVQRFSKSTCMSHGGVCSRLSY